MKSLSLCLIVKNEENNLKKCLKNSLDYADEIIIVDTGSNDKTKEVAKEFTDKIFDFEWCDDFSKARNFSFENATSEYCIWLDADDFLTEESVNAIKKWKGSEEDCDVVMSPYVAGYDEKLTPTFEYLRERIVKNSSAFRWHDRVHEVIVPSGKIITNNEILIYHGKKTQNYSDRNLMIYKKMLALGEPFTPRNQFYYARELYFNKLYDEAIHAFSKFLTDGKGWKENNIEACLNLARCYKQKKQINHALTTLFGSFIYDLPRSEILYEIGNIFMEKAEYNRAIYWFKRALESKNNIQSGAFINTDTSTFLPAIQLCVCYDKIGDKLTAYHYNEIAKFYRPDDRAVKQNIEYFSNIFKQK